jgi:hypothetical protein
MLFRDFSVIAAAAYAAAATARFHATKESDPAWDDLTDDERNANVRKVMAVARGEFEVCDDGVVSVFDATAQAILDHNNGQGLLALEDLMNLGSTVISLNLRTEDEVSGRSIREDVTELLHELQERRQNGTLQGISAPGYYSKPAYQALELLATHFPGNDSETALRDFAQFVSTEVPDTYDHEARAVLELACNSIRNSGRVGLGPREALKLAERYRKLLHPTEPDQQDSQEWPVNGNAELATEEEAATVQ